MLYTAAWDERNFWAEQALLKRCILRSRSGQRPPSEMRLRSARPRVTLLSRKVLIGLGAVSGIGIGGAPFLALEPQRKSVGSELYSTDNRNTPDGLASLSKDYTGLPHRAPRLGPPLPGDASPPLGTRSLP